MKKYLQTSLKWFLIIAVFQFMSVTEAAVRTDTQGVGLLGKTLIADSGQFDGNRIRNDLENNGMLVSHRITGHSGMEWPKGSHKYINFASGIWIAGKVGGDIRTAVGEYGPEFVAGPWGSESGDSEHQLYIVNKADLADPLASDDFQNWPADLGAPWVDEDGDGVYSPMPAGPDHPEFIGDQVIWWVMNDGDIAEHSIFHTLPVGVEVQMTLWGYDRPDAFGDMMFVKALIINKGGVDVDDTIIGLWADPDLGYAGDDFVGCDVDLSLGFCYNDGPDSDYGSDPPAIGYDFFQGPLVPCEEADIADSTNTDCYPGSLGGLAYGTRHAGMKNLPMSSFTKYINGDPVYYDPNDAIEAYNYMSGILGVGTPFVNSAAQWNNRGPDGEIGTVDDLISGDPGFMETVSKFVHACDPNNDTGVDDCWVDSDDHASGDRRFLMNAGPFTLADGDSQEVVFGMIIARGSDALSSVTALKEADKLAQLAYDIQFALPESPSSPSVSEGTTGDAIVLSWDDGVNAAEGYVAEDVIDKLPVAVAFDTTLATAWRDSFSDLLDPALLDSIVLAITFDADSTLDTTFVPDTVWIYDNDTTWVYNVQYIASIDTTFEGENTSFTFQGYNVYQLETASGQGARKRIATYDLIDGITEIFDDVFDPTLGETINRRVQFGSDSGIKRSIVIDTDGLNAGIPLKTNRAYYFAVTTYGYNPYGIPRTLESPMNIMEIRPQIATTRDDAVTSAGTSSIDAAHSSGASDGSVRAVVVDPYLVTGDEYQVSFHLNADSSALVWDVVNTTDGTTLVSGNPIQGGVDMASGSEVGEGANPITEGLQIIVNGPPSEFKDFYATQNAGGAIEGNAGASADYNGYPGMGRDNMDNQQTNGSTWFITTSNGDNKNYEDFFPYVTRYAGGYGNPAGGMQYLIPDDFEFRFTETGSKMLNRTSRLVVDTPLEIWNIGDVNDPSDDFQMMGLFNDSNEDGEWNMYQDDSPISGASNDPYMEGFYVVEHADRAPGTAGYEAMVAAFTADPSASGAYEWATGPGLPLSVDGQISRAVLLNMTFANWNGGDVTADPFVVDAAIPETGTIFRMVTTKPNSASDVFTISTSSYMTGNTTFDPQNINVWPNPYFGYNPEERTSLERRVTFTHLPEADGTATIRIFNLAGQLVKKLDHNDGTQFEVWDLTNNFNIPVSSGMYIAHIVTDQGDRVLKIAIVQPEERIDVY